ncbi:GrpB family protein [Shouchella lonarensis]|uniref:GrpB domain, predicted nucleotidyltransferase, UPF0157 family n=1 Tax=Shouchella lonarensis TaxID=1464122 RepID=A0A1G6NHC9_9BACI|nr:GrpB family protein [Shouchella lonarensis]SDC66657.1 GrpB domain, predicted nucleotidyltransferase, UPF0157 family [Shouchella lonarensis]
MSQVKLVKYDPAWPEAFFQAKEAIACAMSEKIERIEHVGSTSIPGMMAKPIIDIGVTVRILTDIDEEVIKKLYEIGFEHVPKAHDHERLFFRRGAFGAGTHHLHIYEDGSKMWLQLLFFRDYLRENQEAARAYQQLKQALAVDATERSEYTRRKAPFIRAVLEKGGL